MQSINAGFQSLRTLLPRHEGEKLSKAAILQQTAEYIYSLEQEKTRLLSQNSQLKRLLSQHEGGDVPLKKRKSEIILSDCPVIAEASEDSDMEPVSLITVTKITNVSPSSEINELRVQLERERRFRVTLEDQVRNFESQLYPDNIRELSHQITLQYENSEVIEQNDGLREMIAVIPEEAEEEEEEERIVDGEDLHLISIDLPTVGEHRTVAESETCSRPPSPIDMAVGEERSSSPIVQSSILEAAIKAEPKVEVEVLPSPDPASPGEPSRLFLANTSRQNLETIVEAIRHLEGDHMFAEEQPGHEQDLPLALTNKPEQRRLLVDMNDFLHFHPPQTRPGVIVGKHS